jgi:hypothetical protein
VLLSLGLPVISTQTTQILATFPRSGEYCLEVQNVTELLGGVPLQVDGMTLTLRLAVCDEVLRVKVRGGCKGACHLFALNSYKTQTCYVYSFLTMKIQITL